MGEVGAPQWNHEILREVINSGKITDDVIHYEHYEENVYVEKTFMFNATNFTVNESRNVNPVRRVQRREEDKACIGLSSAK